MLRFECHLHSTLCIVRDLHSHNPDFQCNKNIHLHLYEIDGKTKCHLCGKFVDIPIIKKKPKERWEPEKGEIYYPLFINHIGSDGRCYEGITWKNDSNDQYSYSIGNCFKTKEQSHEAAEKVKDL